MIGGSADLAPSNKSDLKFDGAGEFLPGQYKGRNLHFGIREHAMGSICNGLSLSGIRPYGGTFFVFTDYMRPSMRLASIMGVSPSASFRLGRAPARVSRAIRSGAFASTASCTRLR